MTCQTRAGGGPIMSNVGHSRWPAPSRIRRRTTSMALKLSVGVSRKVGQPDYGSVGASCQLELEVDSALLERDLDGFHARVRDAYVAAHQAVHDELARLQ